MQDRVLSSNCFGPLDVLRVVILYFASGSFGSASSLLISSPCKHVSTLPWARVQLALTGQSCSNSYRLLRIKLKSVVILSEVSCLSDTRLSRSAALLKRALFEIAFCIFSRLLTAKFITVVTR
ncbi:hypothetical protein TMatcc_007856 [Talaromyces marneffei ATCC 18224]